MEASLVVHGHQRPGLVGRLYRPRDVLLAYHTALPGGPRRGSRNEPAASQRWASGIASNRQERITCKARDPYSLDMRSGPKTAPRAHMGRRVCTASNHLTAISPSKLVGISSNVCQKSWTSRYLVDGQFLCEIPNRFSDQGIAPRAELTSGSRTPAEGHPQTAPAPAYPG